MDKVRDHDEFYFSVQKTRSNFVLIFVDSFFINENFKVERLMNSFSLKFFMQPHFRLLVSFYST